MATLKDVAKYVGVSATTVSLVVNGRADEKRVSEKTRQRIYEAIKVLDYKPNLAARRLKNSASHKFSVALYWPSDDRTTFLSRILNGLYSEVRKLDFKCDIVVCLFEKDKLRLESELHKEYAFDAAIVGAISKNDMKYLEELEASIPVILYNRELDKYSSVLNTYEVVFQKIIQELVNKQVSNITLFQSDTSYLASQDRTASFIKLANEANISTKILRGASSYEGGYALAMKWQDQPTPFIFSESDIMSFGALRYFNEIGLKIPDEVELISIGLSEIAFTAFTSPSLSILSVPTEQMSQEVVRILYNILENKQTEPEHKYFELEFIKRESY